MGGLTLILTMVLMKVLMLFVDQDEYRAKVATVLPMDGKHVGFDLGPWTYRRLWSGDSTYQHRYYYHPPRDTGAPVFLFVHGLNLDGRTFLRLESLSRYWTLVAYDLPEQCPKFSGAYDDWRGVIDDFIEQLRDTIVAVGGVSFGAGIAQHCAANNPGVDRLVLMSTTMINETPLQRLQSRWMAGWIGSLADYQIYWLMETLMERNTKKLEGEERDVLEVLRIKHPAFYREVALSTGDYDAVADARKVTCPTLMLMGDRDTYFADDQEKVMRRYIPHMEYEVIRGATHSMVYVHGDEVAARILAFCRRNCSSPWLDH
jgi:pimeloyl-ACP methyl ester carboxylesterase